MSNFINNNSFKYTFVLYKDFSIFSDTFFLYYNYHTLTIKYQSSSSFYG